LTSNNPVKRQFEIAEGNKSLGIAHR
jgi:hypothetical protein